MVGGARKGYCSKLRPRSVLMPISTVMIAMTMATIGRRMKKSATALLLAVRLRRGRRGRQLYSRRRRRRNAVGLELGLDLHARAGFLNALDDDPFAGLESGGDEVEVLVGVPQRHGALGNLVTVADHEHGLGALQLLD